MPARHAMAAMALAIAASFAHAQVSDDKVKIGFITDMSGVYADLDGPGGQAFNTLAESACAMVKK